MISAGKGAAFIPARATDIKGIDPLALADRFKKDKADAQARQDKQDAAKAKADKEFDDSIELSDKDFLAKISTIDSFDDVNRDFANTSRDAYLSLAKKAKEFQRGGNTRDLNIVLNRMAKIKGNFKNSNTVADSLLSKVENFNKLHKEGKLSDADAAYAQKMTDLGKFNFTVGVDEDGIAEIYTPASDGKKREKHRLSEFLTGFNPVEVYDVDNFLDNVKELETSVTSGSEGGYIVTEEGISEQAKAAIEADIAAVTEGDEYMTDLLYKATGGAIEKREGFTEEDRTKVGDFLRDKALGQFTDKREQRENKFALENTKAKNKAKAKKDETEKSKALLVDDENGLKTFTFSQGGSKNKGLTNIDRNNPDLALTDMSVATDPDGNVKIYGVFKGKPNKDKGLGKEFSETDDSKIPTERHELSLAEIKLLANDLRNSGEDNDNILEILDKQIELERGRGTDTPDNFSNKGEQTSATDDDFFN